MSEARWPVNEFRPSGSAKSVVVDSVAGLVDHVVGLVLCVAEKLLGLASSFISLAFLLEPVVASEVSGGLLDAALCLIEILVHDVQLSVGVALRKVVLAVPARYIPQTLDPVCHVTRLGNSDPMLIASGLYISGGLIGLILLIIIIVLVLR